MMGASEGKEKLLTNLIHDAEALRKGSNLRYDQICFKYDIKGSAKKELFALISIHFNCVDECIKILKRIE